jgi:O-antigen/teichoic acid export membrane protein
LLTLDKFGYYSLATVVASSPYLFIGPIFAAVFPRFSQLIAADDEANLRALYHSSAQLLSVLLIPTALTLALFAPEILSLWLRDPTVVQNVHLLVSLLVIGTALNGLATVPYALQIAAGWTKLPLYQNMVAVMVLLPCLFWATNHYGAIGAAWIWIAVNGGYVMIGIQVMHTRLLRSEKWYWYTRDVGLPLAGTVGIALAARSLFPTDAPSLLTVGGLASVALLLLMSACMLTPLTIQWIRTRLNTKRAKKI